jgi:hypothetical protein
VQRYPVTTHRDCSLGIISFQQLAWDDHHAQLVDISVVGVGIESQQQISPGLVWFKKRIGGYKSGVLMWSRPFGASYRAGIKFVQLSRHEESYLQEQTRRAIPREPVHDPDRILSSILDAFKKELPEHA